MRPSIYVLAAALVVAAGQRADAQSLASRVGQAPDGVVRMEFHSRAGVCGDGDDVVGYRTAIFARNFQSIGGRWSTSRCEPGALRVTLDVVGGDVRRVRTQVGGDWPATGSRVTDLGVVPAREASAYFFSLVPRLESGSSKERLLLPAVLADDAPVVEPLIALARSQERTGHTRRAALSWLGLLGDPPALRLLRTIIEDGDESDGLRAHAVFALAHGTDTPGSEFTYLRDLYARERNRKVKEAIIHGMSQDEGDGARWLIAHALDRREPMDLRKNALFWAGQGDGARTAELLRVYQDVGEAELREHAIFVLSQRREEAATDALIRIAREDRDTEMRGKALFWLAQKDDPRVRKLIADLVLR